MQKYFFYQNYIPKFGYYASVIMGVLKKEKIIFKNILKKFGKYKISFTFGLLILFVMYFSHSNHIF